MSKLQSHTPFDPLVEVLGADQGESGHASASGAQLE